MHNEKTIIEKQKRIIEELKEGNKRFLDGVTIQEPGSSLIKLKKFATNGQTPKAIVLCCSDSRAPVEMIFDQDIGDLFVIRVAGNIVAPSLVGSVEFAAITFGTPIVLVMGHTQCGAIRATLENIENPQKVSSENLHDIVSRIRPYIFKVAQRKDISDEEKARQAVEANVLASVGQLAHSSRLLENLVFEHKLTIIGSVFDLSTGEVTFLDT